MKLVFDTNSLLALVRYYLPFDGDRIIYNFIKEKINSQEIILIDKVFTECKNLSRGLVFDSLRLEEHRKNIFDTSEILPDKKFFNLLVNNFCDGSIRNRFSEEEFETEKTKFLNLADAKLVIYGYNNLKLKNPERIIIVSEETLISKDNKTFKKIPFMCRELKIKIMTLPEVVPLFSGFKISINKI